MIYFKQDTRAGTEGYFPYTNDDRLKHTMSRIYGVNEFPCIVYKGCDTLPGLAGFLHELGHHADYLAGNVSGYRDRTHDPMETIMTQEVRAWAYVFRCTKPKAHTQIVQLALRALWTYATHAVDLMQTFTKAVESLSKEIGNVSNDVETEMRRCQHIYFTRRSLPR